MRTATLLIFVSALHASVVITPQKPPVVPAGGVLHLKANVPVTWSLAPGSPGSIDADGTYHAPATVPVKNILAGCQILGNDHIFNTRIDSLPVDPRSAAWMSLIPNGGLGYYPGWGINIADSSTPKKQMHFLYTPQNDGTFEMVPWPYLKRETGVFSDSNSPVDRHEVTIDRQTCDVYEVYSAYDRGKNKGCPTCTGQSGVHYNSLSSSLPDGSVDAASLLLTPLTLGLEEIRSGAIQHALRMTLKNNIIAPTFVWPARTNAGAWGKIPYGTRFRLKGSYDISHFSPYAQELLKQLKEYGLVLADGGGNFDVSTYTDITEDTTVEDAIGQVGGKGPRSSDFEIVDESHLMASPGAGGVKQGSEYATPDGYASVIATSTQHNSDVGRARIVLQGITVGVPNPTEWVQSDVSIQLKSWVNGTAQKGVRWSMNPPLGTLTAEGRYIAPPVERPTSTLLTVASAADPKSTAKVALTVMPKGAIRIAVGNATRAPGAPNRFYPDYGPDSNGNMWWRGQGGEVTWGVVVDDWYGEPWPKAKDIQLYYTSRYSLGDMVYRFYVPNGRYKITMLFAQPQCKTTYPRGWRVPFDLETQGKLVVPDFDMGAGTGDACLAPVTQSMPADVADNSLYLALRRVTSGPNTPSPIISAFEIAPDDSAAHLSVSPGKIASLKINQQIQFRTVGWHMTNGVTWSVVKGPGTVTPDGLYTAPATPAGTDQPIVLQATSTSDRSKTATAEMVLRLGNFALSPAQTAVARSLSEQLTPTLDGAKYTNVSW
ncbi:MAG: malectin, partial [Acidobacteriota bacterium]|nr:malectin [Acidobacteriota bacterium]